MSASRTLLRAKKVFDETTSDDEECGFSETGLSERDIILRRVKEGAKKIRVINMLTMPFLNDSWMDEDDCFEGANNFDDGSHDVITSVPSKENLLRKKAKKSVMFSPKVQLRELSPLGEQNSVVSDYAEPSPSKPTSPMKLASSAQSLSPLKMEKIPAWKPLRKSKSRQSIGSDLENLTKSSNNIACLGETSSKISTVHKSASPVVDLGCVRSPLKTVKTANQTPVKRRNSSNSSDGSSLCSSIKVSSSPFKSSLKQTSILGDFGDKVLDVSKKSVGLSIYNPTSEENLSKKAEAAGNESTPTSEHGSDLFEDDSNNQACVETPRSHLKSMQSPIKYSSILKQAYGEQAAKVRGSIGSPQKLVSAEDEESIKDASKVLKGVTAYVEVRRGEDDRTGGFRWKLKQLGATLSETLTKKVTHVVFQEGLLSTFRKAKELKVHLVSAHWVMVCDESLSKAPEADYPIEKLEHYELADPLKKSIRRPKLMSPDIGSGRDDKRLSRRFKTIQRKSLLVESPLAKCDVTASKVPLSGTPKRDVSEFNGSFTKEDEEEEEEEQDDDWDDGFLDMVKAQVRAKAESKVKAEEVEKAVKDFELQVQVLLGRRNENSSQAPERVSTPLASIFQMGKCHPSKVKKSSSVSRRAKQSDVVPPNSMMNWLRQKAPGDVNKSLQSGNSPMSASAAADALSDEILKNMIDLSSSEDLSLKPAHQSASCPSKSLASKLETSDTKAPSDKDKSLMKSTAKETSLIEMKVKAKSSQIPSLKEKPVPKQSAKKNKANSSGNVASSAMMRSWLTGVKSPPTGLQNKDVSEGSPPKRMKFTPTKISNLNQASTQKSASKALCRVTPQKSDTQGTPQRRRSARLTPLKCGSPVSKLTLLASVPEIGESCASSRKENGRSNCNGIVRATPQKRATTLRTPSRSTGRKAHCSASNTEPQTPKDITSPVVRTLYYV